MSSNSFALLVLFALVGIGACSTPKEQLITRSGLERSQVTFTDSLKVAEIMNFLASDDLKGRDSGSEGIERAADFIAKKFESHGILPFFDTYRDTLSNFNPTAYNIVGYLEGKDAALKNEIIIIGAHYDHIGILKPTQGDSIANGANDNASGTTAVLEFARYFAQNKNNKRTLVFALFTAEEKGLKGSEHLAKKLQHKGQSPYLMLNFEMIGVPLKNWDYHAYITGYEKSNLAEVCNTLAGKNLIGFLPKANEYNLFKRSDNYPFYEVFGIAAHTFCTFDFTNYDYYHKVGDEIDALDLDHMANLINEMMPMVEGLVNQESKIKLKKI